MATEKHNGRIYHFGYLGKRPSGTTIRAYFGTGPAAEWLSQIAADQRAERHRRRAKEQLQRQQILSASRLSRRAIEAVKQVMAAELGKLGYVQHDRGVWRKRLHSKVKCMARKHRFGEVESCDIPLRLPKISGYKRRDYSSGRQAPELADAAMTAWFDTLSAADPPAGAALRLQLQQLRDQLLNQGDSQLERVCVGRIIVCSLEVQMIGLRILMTDEMSEPQAVFLRERQRAANRRLATAVKALQTARRIFKRELNDAKKRQRSRRVAATEA